MQISPSTVKREEFGFMVGQVVSVGEFPATRQGMFRVLGSEELVQALSVDEALIEVHVDLALDTETPSGYTWSSSEGPPTQVDSGTFCAAWIKICEQRPLSIVPIYERAQPILQTLPEVDPAQSDPGELTGEIEVSHVVFRYKENEPLVLRDISLHVKPGQFVALVGPSGCGKSTLVRLLLGFGAPQSESKDTDVPLC